MLDSELHCKLEEEKEEAKDSVPPMPLSKARQVMTVTNRQGASSTPAASHVSYEKDLLEASCDDEYETTHHAGMHPDLILF